MHTGIELYLTCSVGIALMPDDGLQVYDLLMNAETAMATAKRGGGNGFRFYVREMNANSAERIAMESELRHAVERDELFLQFQPCVDAATLKTIGVEALVRWRHPERGLIPPDRFIPIADESGLIVDIGEWVLRQSCYQAKGWHDLGYDNLSVSVNVSAVQFAQPRLARHRGTCIRKLASCSRDSYRQARFKRISSTARTEYDPSGLWQPWMRSMIGSALGHCTMHQAGSQRPEDTVPSSLTSLHN